ncbi:MAG TPA: hypothetical protein VE175_11975, partial [Woeseiaceae bacterium]|nr:hypothetical protein [Woeseiaceae bacterium]
MKERSTIPLVLLCALPIPSAGEAPAGAIHDEPYWQAIVANDFEPPPDASIDSLARELAADLGSPDPVLRDDIAYRVLTQWMY